MIGAMGGILSQRKSSKALFEQHVDVAFTNDATERTYMTATLPTSLAAGDIIDIAVQGENVTTVNTVTFQNRLKIGATTLLATSAVSHTASANPRRWLFTARLIVVSPTSQLLEWQMTIGPASSTAGAMGAALAVGAGSGTAAEDLSAGKDLTFTIQMGSADAAATCTVHSATVTVAKR